MSVQSERLLTTLELFMDSDAVQVKPALCQAATQLAEVFGAGKVDVFLLDPATQTLVAIGASDTPMGRRQKELGLDHQPLANGGRSAEVFQTDHSRLDFQVDRDSEELLGIRVALGVRSQILTPIAVNGERRGVLAVQSGLPESFTAADLLFCEAVAKWIGVITHRAEIVEQLTEQAHRDGRREGRREADLLLLSGLTSRELEVATLITLGLTNAEIAERLSISTGTAANHIAHILEKFGVSSRARIAAIMTQLDIDASGRERPES